VGLGFELRALQFRHATDWATLLSQK
jgi:hypothetical protein